jgi:hypothetical protein
MYGIGYLSINIAKKIQELQLIALPAACEGQGRTVPIPTLEKLEKEHAITIR